LPTGRKNGRVRSQIGFKSKNPTAPAVKREAEEDWSLKRGGDERGSPQRPEPDDDENVAAMDKDHLRLKRAALSRPSGEWNDDDFHVAC
jgi:hypothetical protein